MGVLLIVSVRIPHNDYKFVVCPNNTVRGAAGGAVLRRDSESKRIHHKEVNIGKLY